MAGRWGSLEDAMLSLMGRAALQPAPNARRYQLLLNPAFDPPSCLEVEETAGGVFLAFAILQDRDGLNAAFAATSWRKAGHPLPAEVAKGRCWEDVADMTPEHEAAFRRLCAEVDPWLLDDHSEGARDGIVLWLRCEMPGQSRTIHMWSPTRAASPAHHQWITVMLDLAASSFGDQVCLAYLASLRRYLKR